MRRAKPSLRAAGASPSVAAKERMSPPAMKCRPAPRSTTTRRLSSPAIAVVCATSASTIDGSRTLSSFGRLRVSVATGPSRAKRTVSFIGKSLARAIYSRLARRLRRFRRRAAKRSRGVELVDGVRDVHALPRAEIGDRARELAVGDRVRGPGRAPAGGRGRACARPGRRPRSARSSARCRSRSPGSSRPRSAIPARSRSCPNTGPTACWRRRCRARRRSAVPSRWPSASITFPGQVGADALEELEAEIRRRMVVAVGALVAAMEERPVGRRDLAADLARERDAGRRDAAALLLHFLALVVVERREEVGEVAKARILPAELQAVAHDHAGSVAGARFGFGRKQDVQRRKGRIADAAPRLQPIQRRAQQRRAHFVVAGETAAGPRPA